MLLFLSARLDWRFASVHIKIPQLQLCETARETNFNEHNDNLFLFFLKSKLSRVAAGYQRQSITLQEPKPTVFETHL